MAKSFLALVASFILMNAAFSQNDFASEEELKTQAQKLFDERKLVEASPLFAQLLSLYPQDPNYNYKYGATLLEASADREKPLKYLKFSLSKSSQVEPLAYYFLGKAYHLSYNFADAVKYYSRFKQKADNGLIEEFQVDRQIEMAKNGNQLLSKLNEVQVLDKQVISRKDFFRIYELEGINGKIIVKPEEFMTKYDQKVGEKSVIYLPTNAAEVYFSSYGKKGENGRDIFKTVKLGNRSWSEPVNLGPSINTPYDENYPFIHPDGRTLYFASKGHSSMGGYDLFMSVYDQGTAQWKAPINLDFAFSSVDDDILFVTDQNKVLAYFASSRANEADNITVYKVMVEKAPAELSVIKGKFIAENNPDVKKAKITVIDSKTQQTIGIYDTDEEGNYQVEIASNGGTYRFNIETTSDSPIHTGEVDIPRQDKFEVLGQELRLVGTGDNQQLVIKNIFDGTVAQAGGGPKISSETLRKKALLDINFSEDALAALTQKRASEGNSNTVSNQGNQTGSNNELAATNTTPNSKSQTNNQSKTGGAGNSVVANPSAPVVAGGIAATTIAGAGTQGSNDNKEANETANAGSSETVADDNSAIALSTAGIDPEKKQSIENRIQSLDADLSKKSLELTAQSSLAYQKAAKFKQEADQAFLKAGIDPKQPNASIKETNEGVLAEGNSEDAIENADLSKAKELASRAAINAALAQKIDAGASKMNGIKGGYQSDLKNIKNDIDNGEYSSANKKIDEIEEDASTIRTGEKYLASYREELEEAIQEEEKILVEEEQKLNGLKAEGSRIDSSIVVIESEIASSATPTEGFQKQLDELKLDKSDLQFQLSNTEALVKAKKEEIAALNLEKEEVVAISTEFAQLDPSAISSSEPTASERNQMIEDLKVYRDNSQLAYSSSSSTNEASLSPSDIFIGESFASTSIDQSRKDELAETVKGTEDPSTSNQSLGANANEAGGQLKSITSIETAYLADLNKAESLPDTDLQNARKVEVYEEWIRELNKQADLRRNSLASISDPAEKQKVQDEINQLSREVASINSDQEVIKSAISASGSDIATSNQGNQGANAKQPTQGNVNSNNVAGVTSASADADLAAKSASLAAAIQTTELADVQADSPYPSGLNTFNFDKGYRYSANEVSPALKSVKTSLYQAKEYSSKAEAARSAAYTLPSVEERKQAFEDVNQFEESSEVLQIQAMKDVGVVNQQEFFRNASILNNLNDYDNAEVESNNLDMANLLQDEAETYFNNAQVIRSEAIGSTAKTGVQRVKLQKAYDLEMLALNKQRQALESLKLVDAEVEQTTASTDSRLSQLRDAQIQTITDPKVLAIEDATVARTEGDALVTYANQKEEEAKQLRKTAEVEDIGPKRDSLMALYQEKQDSALQLRSKASIYYEREKQIETGFKADIALDAGILKPALIFTQTYELDTINVDDERKNAILASKEYKTFMTAARDNQQLRMAAKIEYDKAVELRKRQFELDREAQVLLSSASQADSPAEKERRIKQAQVIELKADKIDDSIDSLNKIIRVKNYLVATSEDKMKGTIASLSATQQAEIIYLVNQEVDIHSTDLDYAEVSSQPSQSVSELAAVNESNASKPSIVATGGGTKPVVGEPIENVEAPTTTKGSNEIANNPTSQVTEENTVKSDNQVGVNTGQVKLSPPIPVKAVKKPGSEEAKISEPIANNTPDEKVETLKDGTVNPNNIIRSAPRRPISLTSIDRVPRRMEEPIFIKLGLNESAYNNEKPIPTLTELPEGLVYKVQVGAFRKPIPQDLFKGFAPLTSEAGPNGITRYTAGLFTGEREAVGARDEIRNFGYKDAFVVAFRNGERISITSARTAESNSPRTESGKSTATISSAKPAESSSNSSVPAKFENNIKNLETIKELFFSVQIGVFSKEVKSGTFSSYKDVNAIKLPTGLIRYNAGIFNSLEEAESYKNQINSNIPDAFVVVYFKGKRISLDEAARIMNQN